MATDIDIIDVAIAHHWNMATKIVDVEPYLENYWSDTDLGNNTAITNPLRLTNVIAEGVWY